MPKTVTFAQCKQLISAAKLPVLLTKINGIHRLYVRGGTTGIVFSNPQFLWERLQQIEEETQPKQPDSVDLRGKTVEEREAIALDLIKKGEVNA
jgi:hypothetical protein